MNEQTTDSGSPLYFTPAGLVEKLQSNIAASTEVDG